MKVMGIALDTRTGSPIVVLHDLDNRRALPIWIGSAEASAIIRKIEKLSVTRPMTHDLIIDIVKKTGYSIDRIEINDVEKIEVCKKKQIKHITIDNSFVKSYEYIRDIIIGSKNKKATQLTLDELMLLE